MQNDTENEIGRSLFPFIHGLRILISFDYLHQSHRYLVFWDKCGSYSVQLILGIILHLRTVIQINIIYFCLQKRDTGSGPLYPIMGFGQISPLFDYNGGTLLKQN